MTKTSITMQQQKKAQKSSKISFIDRRPPTADRQVTDQTVTAYSLLPTPYVLLLALFFLLLVPVSTALAQDPEIPDYDRVNKIAKNMNCPTCVGVNLSDCGTQTCEQWRVQISDLLQEGYTEQEVFDYFAEQYGDRVLLDPPKEGSTLVLWILPVVGLLLGSAWLGYVLFKWRRPKLAPVIPDKAEPGPVSSAPQVSDDYLKQVEKDLDL